MYYKTTKHKNTYSTEIKLIVIDDGHELAGSCFFFIDFYLTSNLKKKPSSSTILQIILVRIRFLTQSVIILTNSSFKTKSNFHEIIRLKCE